jgi:anti-sigma regulatory factor (Ser/Thr protein kinase)
MMSDARTACYSVLDATQVGEARRAAAGWAQEMNLDHHATGKLAILVTELANNLHRHARDGVILLRKADTGVPAIELLAVDKGPGMADVQKCFRDGYSTIGTPGTGLGSVARLADDWDIYSVEGSGTVLMRTAWVTAETRRRHRTRRRRFSGREKTPLCPKSCRRFTTV